MVQRGNDRDWAVHSRSNVGFLTRVKSARPKERYEDESKEEHWREWVYDYFR